MKNYAYKNILALLVFGVLVWSVNSYMSGMIDDNLKNINSLKKELALKESFTTQKSTDKLSKSINDFVPDKLDKVATINYINKLSQDSLVNIVSIDVKEVNTKYQVQDSEVKSSKNKTDIIDQELEKKSNTFKKAELSMSLAGNKQALDKFMERLVESKQYIDIGIINFDFKTQSNIPNSQDIGLNITATIYYKN